MAADTRASWRVGNGVTGSSHLRQAVGSTTASNRVSERATLVLLGPGLVAHGVGFPLQERVPDWKSIKCAVAGRYCVVRLNRHFAAPSSALLQVQFFVRPSQETQAECDCAGNIQEGRLALLLLQDPLCRSGLASMTSVPHLGLLSRRKGPYPKVLHTARIRRC